MSSLFVCEADVDELTGIKVGRNGKTKHQMQCDFLRGAGIPFVRNARGRPVVTVAAIEGKRAAAEPVKSWAPKALTI